MLAATKRIATSCFVSALLMGTSPSFATPSKTPVLGAPVAARNNANLAKGNIIDLKPIENDWIKACEYDQKAICYTTRDFSRMGNSAPVLALGIYNVKDFDMQGMRVFFPLGVKLSDGFQYSIDGAPLQKGSFVSCNNQGCLGDAVNVHVADLTAFERGAILKFIVKDQADHEITINVPLTDFGKDFAGPGVNPEVLRTQLSQLQTKLHEKMAPSLPANSKVIPPLPPAKK
jgi:invasion protein IalB